MTRFFNCTERGVPKLEMVVFDYGETLLMETGMDFLKGEREVFRYIDQNPSGITPEDFCRFGNAFFADIQPCRDLGFELHEWQGLRATYEFFGLTFTLPMEELECILWDAVSLGEQVPGASSMLDDLHKSGIRTGVISNICWSGQALARRMQRLLPENWFEFILASSEYGIRKPNPLLFQIALRKAGLPPEKVWYCGDNFQFDVCGAHAAGIFPVWLNREGREPEDVDFPYLAVSSWEEFVDILHHIEVQNI